ncbi:opacity protein-like surface antigen [Methylobacterium sp. BE186]|uniref:outer membrane protein n=1 Tax=Methylobacterium sp. BE186 TaxID=2817715 RepID=UPI00285EDF40|nr:outer membrane beta-barrel protein [Methylobacterium sp. BE186]MDR7038155.1 opacity protein-like surface antigen [Methylobacterium sp. BE186]
MMRPWQPRALRLFASGLLLAGCLLRADPAAAQGVPFVTGFGALPAFAWPPAAGSEENRWAGSYARLSTGFEVSSSKRFGRSAGPTIGFEGGRMWQEGRFVFGVAGGFDYLSALGGVRPGLSGLAYTRDFAGALQVKVGTLLTPDVLLYARGGVLAVHGTLQDRARPVSRSFAREDIAVVPDAHVGVEWAVTDRLSVAVEAGVVGGNLR